MNFESKHDLFSSLTFTTDDNDQELTGKIVGVTAAEVGLGAYAIFYVVEVNEDHYSVEEITLHGHKTAFFD